jgi:EAL domain-containing protein (putative c-di-GMP-specific phosphodiesterase class I)
MENPVYLGRQPIYGPGREIRGYELLYRRALGDTVARISDSNQATADVMLKAIIEIGLHKVAPERPVFINHPRTLLEMDPILPPDRCVVEVLEDVAADEGSVEALMRLRKLSYRIALDDFVYRDELAPMVRLADYVKLDYRVLGERGFREQMRLLKPYRVAIVAEKIESEEEFRLCKEMGCTLFQGYYLRKPDLLAGRRIPSNKLSVLSLLARMHQSRYDHRRNRGCDRARCGADVRPAAAGEFGAISASERDSDAGTGRDAFGNGFCFSLGDAAVDGGKRRLSGRIPGDRAAARAHVRTTGGPAWRVGAGGVHDGAALHAGFSPGRSTTVADCAVADRQPV